jgi:hypothetical protein
VAAGAVIALIAAAFVGNNVVARQYTPDGAVRQYLDALQARDAAGAWAEMQVTVPQQSVAASLTDQSALRAALATTPSAIVSYDVTNVSYSNDSTAHVNVSIQTSKGTQQAQFVVERSGQRRYGLYPIWHVLVSPALLSFAVPDGTGGIAIDGQAIDIKAGTPLVAVLPLTHLISFKGTSLLADQTVSVDALKTNQQAVSYQPAFTSAGLDKIKGSIRAFFGDVCAKQSSPTGSDNCPQTVKQYLGVSGAWKVVGDPAEAISTVMDSSLKVSAVGHFQMVFGYSRNGIAGTQHVPDGAGYSAQLVLSDTDVRVDHIARDNQAAGRSRPAGATDQTAEGLVAAGLKQCAGIAAETVADCPQFAPDVLIDNVRWSLQGDPLSGATVSFDGNAGLYIVHGTFSMSVSYTWFGQHKAGSSLNTHYNAFLFWDGSALQLVTIDGAS